MDARVFIEQWAISNEGVEAESDLIHLAGLVSDEARTLARRLLWVPPAMFGLAGDSMGVRSIMRGCLAARMAKDWSAELAWAQAQSEREALSSALARLGEVGRKAHDGQAWAHAKVGWAERAGEPEGSPLRIIGHALHRGLGDGRARRSMCSAMERLDPEDEHGEGLCRMRWSQWEKACLSGVEAAGGKDGAGSKRI